MPTVLAAVNDLFFSSRIQETARHTGTKLLSASNAAQLLEQARAQHPRAIILDLNSPDHAPLESVQRLKADPELKAIPVVGYLSHVQVDLSQRARAAGCDYVLPRSTFTERLPDILSGTFFTAK